MKNIVICCDGTNNQFSGDHTNVIRLYKVANKGPGQFAFYDPGVGTMPEVGWVTSIGKAWSMISGLAFGSGFFDNISDAYIYLMQVYEPSDKIFIFGFSRGAFTARALAGLLHAIGLLNGGSENLLPYGLRYWQQSKDEAGAKLCAEFRATLARDCKPHFIGVWDTVGSVGFINHFRSFPYTAHNPDVQVVRHAVSIDERRCAFRHNLMFPTPPDSNQDIKNVWFAGVHSDVGGGYPIPESGLAMTAFEWIVREAKAAGLGVDEEAYAHEIAACPPNACGKIHNSLQSFWWILEFFPHKVFSFADMRRHWRLEWNKPRHLNDDAVLHHSVIERMKCCAEYRPPNLKAKTPEEAAAKYKIED